jgi:Protein of unknown function (DUF1622)
VAILWAQGGPLDTFYGKDGAPWDGDIIRTVGVAPTLENVFILALIFVIRTFLSMALQLEVEGRWPWQRTAGAAP